MPGRWFDELASGGGSPEAVDLLVRAERTRRLMLLGEVLDRLDERPDALGELGSADMAWRLIAQAGESRPEAAEELLMSPQVGCWSAHLLRRLHGTADGPPLWVDAGHLFAICLVARLRAGLDADLVVPLWDGGLSLPTLGLVRFPGPRGFTAATARLRGPDLRLTSGGDTITLRPLHAEPDKAARRGGAWLPLRDLAPATTWLDDLDPYRDLDEPIVPEPLDDAEVEHWRRLFGKAVAILRASADGPGRLRPEQVRRIVPWTGAPSNTADGSANGPLLSATTSDAFGSMVISRPPNGLALAETMVHEFQHSKLGALLHLYPLLRDDGAKTHYAPWRPDPRHLTGLLHGAYAFTGVTGFWRDRMKDGATDPETASFHFALRRVQTRLVVHTLLTRAELSATGSRLLHGLATTLDGWLREPVAPETAARARAAARGNLVEWRLHNLRCGDEEASALTAALHAGAPPPPAYRYRPLVAEESTLWTDTRTSLYRAPPQNPASADAHLAAGAPETAIRLYGDTLRKTPDDPHALTGWLLATAQVSPAHRRLLRRPERLLALAPESPEELRRVSDWLCRRHSVDGP
ncbi:HEXXH motif domain-containing protein [Streptomyces sp. 4N509B]|uniref:HEXXH motif domain-containing protein n=1 Tax=Streptomyces sp. 4N509B TaxID=3457413 RepID=UPI003FD101DA